MVVMLQRLVSRVHEAHGPTMPPPLALQLVGVLQVGGNPLVSIEETVVNEGVREARGPAMPPTLALQPVAVLQPRKFYQGNLRFYCSEQRQLRGCARRAGG